MSLRRIWIAVAFAGGFGIAGVAVGVWIVASRRAPPVDVVELAVEGGVAGAVAMERDATVPLERAVAGSPGVVGVTSESSAGRSLVRVTLAGGTDVLRARSEIFARVRAASLPEGVPRPVVLAARGDDTISYRVSATTGADLAAVRATQELSIARALETIPGVAYVTTCGGRDRRIEVTLDPIRLSALGISAPEAADAIAGASTGGSPARGLELRRVEDLRSVTLATRAAVPVRLADVATIAEVAAPAACIARQGGAEIVLGDVALQRGADVAKTTLAMSARLRELEVAGRVEVALLETDASGPWLRGKVGAAEGDTAAVVEAVRACPEIAEVVVRATVGEADILARPTKPGAIDAAAIAVARAVARIPGARYDLTSPAARVPRHLRIARARLRGGDLEALLATAQAAIHALAEVPGVTGAGAPDARLEPETVLEPDRVLSSRLGVRAPEVALAAALALSGRTVGSLAEGDRMVDIVVRLPPSAGTAALGAVEVAAAGGARVPLSGVVRISTSPAPRTIRRENGERYVDVRFNADDRALAAARQRLAADVRLPAGVRMEVARDL